MKSEVKEPSATTTKVITKDQVVAKEKKEEP